MRNQSARCSNNSVKPTRCRAGRKRSTGHREPNGRTQRPRQDDVLDTVCRARCRRLGIQPTVRNLRMVRDSRFGSVLGTLARAGFISGAQEEAGRRFADAEADYARVMGFPRRFGAIAAYGRVTGPGLEPDLEQVESVRRSHAAMRDVFNQLGVLPRRILIDVVMNEDGRGLPDGGIASLRIALNSMVAHFGVERIRNAA